MRAFAFICLLLLACSPSSTPKDAGSPEPDGGTTATDGGMELSNLGARSDGTALTFRTVSANATRLELSVYRTALNAAPVLTKVMERSNGVFSARVALSELPGNGLNEPLFYGYRAWGPNWPYDPAWTPGSATGFVQEVDDNGNRFNPNKLLVDPWALEISHDPRQPGALDGRPYFGDAANRTIDTGARATKGVVMAVPAPAFGARPSRPLRDEVIYEVHVRGLTRNDTSLPVAERGTYLGAGKKAAALAALGVTAVEFLPVFDTQNDQNDVDPGGANYWGYDPLSFFAPERRYAFDKSPGGPTREFQAMVKAFHDAGVKVYIDVVYNHTAEYGLISWRGLDNATFYALTSNRRSAQNHNGVYDDVNSRNPVTQRLIIDSLKHWREVIGVDGWRFDLASTLGNTCEHGCWKYDAKDPNTAMQQIAAALPEAELISEPWAIGDGTYHVGGFPKPWAEWNGQYRDTVRSMQNKLGFGHPTLAALTQRLSGSKDLYGDDGRAPGASINFVTAHDGFTLIDLYSCNEKKNNQPFPWGNSPGGSDFNLSWDQGGDPAAQRLAARTGMALLLLSAGTPMVLGGDEYLRSQQCNNNAFNLDTPENGVAWTWTAEQQAFRTFTERLLAFRKAHKALRPAGFYEAAQLQYFKDDGAPADSGYMNSQSTHAIGWKLDGAALGDSSAAIYVAYNGWSGAVNFTLPAAPSGKSWAQVASTCDGSFAMPGAETVVPAGPVAVCGRGLTLFLAK